jgi:uncharacterized protein with PIN domain
VFVVEAHGSTSFCDLALGRNVGLQVLDIVKRKDVNEQWDASENLDKACEQCHRSYWYPGETDAFYRTLGRRLQERR